MNTSGRTDPCAAHEASFQDRFDGLVTFEQHGTCRRRMVSDHPVERPPSDHQPVWRVIRVRRPCNGGLSFDVLAIDCPDRRDVVKRIELGTDPHLVEEVHRPGGEEAATGLAAGELTAFDDDDVMARTSEPTSSRCARGSAADDQDVDGIVVDQGLASAGWPASGFVPTGNVPSTEVARLSNVSVPASRPVYTVDSGLHHFSYSAR